MKVNPFTSFDAVTQHPFISNAVQNSASDSQPTLSAPSCVLVGEGALLMQCARILSEQSFQIGLLITQDTQLQHFAKETQLPVSDSWDILSDYLDSHPTDYLFSIVNPRILPAAIFQKLRKRAINYHDSLLPHYAGLNATYWALLHQETQHGITWHTIEAGIDTGNILVQKTVAVETHDTSFTLNIRCFETAIQAFTELLQQLQSDQLTEIPQNPEGRSYYGRSHRPPQGGILSWNKPAEWIDTLCRASDFGFYPNALGMPKLASQQALVCIGKAEISSKKSTARPGTLVAQTNTSLIVATSTQDIILSKFCTPYGQPLSVAQLSEMYGLKTGRMLPEPEKKHILSIEKLDTQAGQQQNYWIRKLSKLQPTRLPFTYRKSLSNDSQPPHQVLLPLPAKVQTFVQTLPSVQEARNFLTTAVLVYLARITRQADIQVGFTSDSLRSQLHDLPDFFASCVPLQAEIILEKTIDQLQVTCTQEIEQTRKKGTYPNDTIARYAPLRNRSELQQPILYPIVVAQADLPLLHSLQILGDELTIWIPEDLQAVQLVAHPSRLDADSTQRIASQLSLLLENLVAQPHTETGALPLLTAADKHTILESWNATTHPYPTDVCMHQLVEQQVARTPNAIAVVCGSQQLTYQQLNEKANQLAHRLQASGVVPDMRVGICLEKSLLMVIGVLAIQKAGGAYVPLDPAAPKDRLALVLTDLQLTVLLTQHAYTEKFAAYAFEVLTIDTLATELATQPTQNPTSSVTANNLAYIIYTSGSTGIPKGVMVRHRPAINLIDWVNRTFGMTHTDRVLFVNSLGFDLSVYDIFGLLAAGGSIQIATADELQNPQRLLEILYTQPITLWNSAPATLTQVVPFSDMWQAPNTTALRLAFLSGDWIPMSLPAWITCQFPQAEVISLGGATEATIWSNYFPIPRQLDEQWVSIPYGFPIQNARYHILDTYLQPVPVGVTGELHIGGPCLADGYFNRPELNQEKFIADPFSNHPEAKLYKTGDLARYMPDGNIEFLGRKDHQVKIRGYRIELSEIEAVLTTHEAVQEILVVATPDASGNKRLIAYGVLKAGSTATTSDLRTFLKDKLPEYMIPSLFVLLDSMPLNASGKIDRKALPVPELSAEMQQGYVAPRTPGEYLLAELWANLLQIPKIGIHDHFFESGGHSLLGVQFVSRLRQKTGKNFPLSLLFSHPTIAAFASFLDQIPDATLWSSLVAVQPNGSKPPLYCVHPVTGGVEYVTKMAAYLDEDQPIYGLQAVGICGQKAPQECVYAMAEHYLSLILKNQPEGAYHLAGYSVGGLIAYEMAVRLRAMGKEVLTLILFDTYPSRKRVLAYKHIGLEYIAHSWVKGLLSPRVSLEQKKQVVSSMKTIPKDFVKLVAGHLKGKLRPSQPVDTSPTPSREVWETILEASWKAGNRYRPQHYDGKAVLIRATDIPARHLKASHTFGWEKYIKNVIHVYQIEGDHFSLFREAQSVQTIAGIVRKYIQHPAQKN